MNNEFFKKNSRILTRYFYVVIFNLWIFDYFEALRTYAIASELNNYLLLKYQYIEPNVLNF